MAYKSYPFTKVDEATKRAVFEKGQAINGYDPRQWRRDKCGNAIEYSRHGDEGDYGWEIDHIRPRAKGGASTLDNLQPLWWNNNRRKGDTFPWSCT